MRKKAGLFCTPFLVALVWAQGQIATVSSSSSFRLRDATVMPGQGVSSWPVMAGDTIVAGSLPAVVTFPDGSFVTLNPLGQAKVDLEGSRPVFQLIGGSADYSLKSTGAVQLMAATKTVAPKGLAGVLTTDGTGFWTPSHTAVAATAAGVGVAVGVALAVSGGTSASPSR